MLFQSALGILVAAKLMNVSVPFIFKYLVDSLNEYTGSKLHFGDVPSAIASTAFALVLACKYRTLAGTHSTDICSQ